MMGSFEFQKTKLKGPFLIKPFSTVDNRGYFLKDFEQNIYAECGIQFQVTESFESLSNKNTVRGLHFQTKKPQAKLVRVILGAIQDVIVDLRKGSDTFGKWESFELSDQNREILYVPRGFAHGFMVLSDQALVGYKCDGRYDKESDTGVFWKDENLDIKWPLSSAHIVSERDQGLMSFREFIKLYEGLDQ